MQGNNQFLSAISNPHILKVYSLVGLGVLEGGVPGKLVEIDTTLGTNVVTSIEGTF